MNTKDKIVIGTVVFFVICCMTMIVSGLLPATVKLGVMQISVIGMTGSFLVLIGFIANESSK